MSTDPRHDVNEGLDESQIAWRVANEAIRRIEEDDEDLPPDEDEDEQPVEPKS